MRTVPVLASLRRAYPGARIDWLVNPEFVPAIAHHPDLTAAVAFPRRDLSAWMKRGRFGAAWAWARRTLREPGYDLVVDAQGLARSGLLAWLTRSPRRVGYRDAREFGWLGLNERVKMPRDLHHVDRYLHLVRAMGVEARAEMRLYPAAEDREAVARDERLGGTRYVVVSPATRGLGRAWAIERYAALVRELLLRAGEWGVERVMVVGLESERAYCRAVTEIGAGDARVVDLVGKTSISRLMAVIERAALVVCNDSAAMHMATAFARPMVALLGPTRAEISGPYGRPEAVVSGWRAGDEGVRHRDVARGRAIMDRITVEEALAACGRALGGGDERRG